MITSYKQMGFPYILINNINNNFLSRTITNRQSLR